MDFHWYKLVSRSKQQIVYTGITDVYTGITDVYTGITDVYTGITDVYTGITVTLWCNIKDHGTYFVWNKNALQHVKCYCKLRTIICHQFTCFLLGKGGGGG